MKLDEVPHEAIGLIEHLNEMKQELEQARKENNMLKLKLFLSEWKVDRLQNDETSLDEFEQRTLDFFRGVQWENKSETRS